MLFLKQQLCQLILVCRSSVSSRNLSISSLGVGTSARMPSAPNRLESHWDISKLDQNPTIPAVPPVHLEGFLLSYLIHSKSKQPTLVSQQSSSPGKKGAAKHREPRNITAQLSTAQCAIAATAPATVHNQHRKTNTQHRHSYSHSTKQLSNSNTTVRCSTTHYRRALLQPRQSIAHRST